MRRVGEEVNGGRNSKRQINTCPQTCKHTVRKGIKLIKCVGGLNCTKRDMPKRLWEGREREQHRDRETKRAVQEDKRGLGGGLKE